MAAVDPWVEMNGGNDDEDSVSDFASDKIAAGQTDQSDDSDNSDLDLTDTEAKDLLGAGPAGPATAPAAGFEKPSGGSVGQQAKSAKAAKPVEKKGRKRKAGSEAKPSTKVAVKAKPVGVGPSLSSTSASDTPAQKKTPAKKRAKTADTGGAGAASVASDKKGEPAKKSKGQAESELVSGPVTTAQPVPAVPSARDANDVFIMSMDIMERGYLRHQGPYDRCVSRIRSLLGDTKKSMVYVRNFQLYVPRRSPRFKLLVGSDDDEQRTLCSFSIDETTRMPPSLDSIFKFAEPDPL